METLIDIGFIVFYISMLGYFIISIIVGFINGRKLKEHKKLENNLEQAWVEAVPDAEKRAKVDTQIHNNRIDPTTDDISDEDLDNFLSQITNKIESVSANNDEQTIRDAINKVTKKNEKEYFIEMKFNFTWEEARKYVSDHMTKKGVLRESSTVFWDNASRDERIEDLTEANTFDVVSNLEPHQVIVEANRTIHTAQEPETISFVYTIGKSA